MEGTKQLNLHVVLDPSEGTLVRYLALSKAVLLEVSNDAIDVVGCHPRVDVARRSERHVVPVKGDVHGKRTDDDNLFPNRLEYGRGILQRAGWRDDSHQFISERIASAASSARSPARRQSR
jgi:hypothetical protein